MNCGIDLNTPLSKVVSERIDEQIDALGALAVGLDDAGRLIVEGFVRSSNRFLIAERLVRFGHIVVGPLQEVVESATCKEVRVLGSVVLLNLKVYSVVPYLLDVIRDDDDYLSLVASNLAAAGVVQAGDLMVERLRTLTEARKYEIVGLLTALEKLGVPLPDDVRERFSAPDTPFEIRLSLPAKR
ncbi:hypothetical protein WME73_41305 [Sorangium sp. So ce302]|uniref:hypothetical protein n=1 Tax=unclassified Sorangium TaxID=2621164 RepID=UPI003F6331A1